MDRVLQIGPLALPWSLLLIFIALAVALGLARRLGQAAGVDAEGVAWQALLVGIVAARAGFVLGHLDPYLEAPLSMLDLRDGGWAPFVGLIAGAAFAALRAWRSVAMRGPLWRALGAGLAVWVLGWVLLLGSGREDLALPDIVLPTADGSSKALSDFRGRPVVVNLWATWCPPCRREMPVLQHAQQSHPDIHFVFLNHGETAEQVNRYLGSSKLSLANVLLDGDGRVGEALGRMALPTTLFFDAEGRLAERRVGEVSAATLGQRLERLRSSALPVRITTP